MPHFDPSSLPSGAVLLRTGAPAQPALDPDRVRERALDRRRFLITGALGSLALSLGCRDSSAPPRSSADAGPLATHPAARSPGPSCDPSAAPRGAACAPTGADIEGPYFKAGAPHRRGLRAAGEAGTPLRVLGRVVSAAGCAPIAGAVLEIWHADHAGAYDLVGFAHRATLDTDRTGAFAIETVVPGRYLNGKQYRPAHLHFKLAAPGHRPLTTQLYFEGDPFNAVDPWVRRDRIVPVGREAGGARMAYDFVLQPG